MIEIVIVLFVNGLAWICGFIEDDSWQKCLSGNGFHLFSLHLLKSLRAALQNYNAVQFEF